MTRSAIVIVAAALAFAAVTGTIALTRTLHVGRAATSQTVPYRAIARRTAQLNAFEASLRTQLAHRPPHVPKLPPAPAAAPQGSAAPQRVVYVRPAPIVVRKRRAGGEHEGPKSGNGGDD